MPMIRNRIHNILVVLSKLLSVTLLMRIITRYVIRKIPYMKLMPIVFIMLRNTWIIMIAVRNRPTIPRRTKISM
jgi:hypothetical protein